MRAGYSSIEESLRALNAYFYDMLDSARHVRRHVESMEYEVFWEDSKTRDAVAMRLAAIGEAARNETAETAAIIKAIPFREIRGMCNRIAWLTHRI
jgi:uncharacterized protein with HEPN domain